MSNSSHPNEPSMAAMLEAIHQSNQLFQRSQEQMMQTLTAMMEQLAINTRTVATELPTRLERQPEDRQLRDNLYNWWDGGFRVEIPEFAGGLSADEYLDWATAVDEILSLKEVPPNKQVPLIAIWFRDRATAWWQSYRYRRYLDGLPLLNGWRELKQEMTKEFLPLNFHQTLYQQLQGLIQGSKSVEKYTMDFYRLVARNQLRESPEQLVARYLHGLRPAIQDALQVHTIEDVAVAQVKARAIEQSLTRSRSYTPN
jgi:Retrotransposon gag protein